MNYAISMEIMAVSEASSGVNAIMMNKSPMVVVMGTGAGKSLCFMLLAASCPGGLTVVIVLLVFL